MCVYLYKYILYNKHMTYIIGMFIYNKTKVDMREKEN